MKTVVEAYTFGPVSESNEMHTDDQTDLEQYVRTGCEAAFRRVVDRHLQPVYVSSLRRTGSPELAEEVSQDAFALMARKAASLVNHPFLLGWLMKTVALRSAHVMRTEANRSRRMKRFARSLKAEMAGDAPASGELPNPWNDAVPLLDDAIERLPQKDRQLILMRFVQQQSFRSIGDIVGMTEDSCQKRTSRALEKLRRTLTGKGVTLSTTVLAAGLGAEALKSVPAALSANIATASLANAPSLTSAAVAAHTIQAMTNGKQLFFIAGILIATAVLPATVQWNANRKLRLENKALVRELIAISGSDEPGSNDAVEGDGSSDEGSGKVGTLPKMDLQEGAYVEAVAALTGTQRRESLAAFLKVLEKMTVDSAPEIRRAFSTSSDMGNEQFLQWTLFWERFGEIGGDAAAKFLQDSHGEVWAKSAFRSMLKTWARADQDAAFGWLKENADSKVFEDAFLGFVEGAAYVDIADATRLALTSTESADAAGVRSKGMKALAETIRRTKGLDAMRGWFDSLPESDGSHGAKQSAYGHVYWKLRVAEPALAAEFISAQQGTAWQSEKWIGEHARHYTWKSPREGLDWAFGIGNVLEESVRPSVSNSLLAALKHHRGVLNEWILNNPSAVPEIQQALPGIVAKLDSAEALQAAELIAVGGVQPER